MEVQRLSQKVQNSLWSRKEKKNHRFSFAFLETTQSNVILEFRLSHSAFWETCAKIAEVSV